MRTSSINATSVDIEAAIAADPDFPGLDKLVDVPVLLAVTVVYGRMAGDLEVTAAKAAGIHPIKLLLPAFLLVMGDANLFQRFMSTGSVRTARWSAFGMFWGVLVLELAVIAKKGLSKASASLRPSPTIRILQ